MEFVGVIPAASIALVYRTEAVCTIAAAFVSPAGENHVLWTATGYGVAWRAEISVEFVEVEAFVWTVRGFEMETVHTITVAHATQTPPTTASKIAKAHGAALQSLTSAAYVMARTAASIALVRQTAQIARTNAEPVMLSRSTTAGKIAKAFGVARTQMMRVACVAETTAPVQTALVCYVAPAVQISADPATQIPPTTVSWIVAVHGADLRSLTHVRCAAAMGGRATPPK